MTAAPFAQLEHVSVVFSGGLRALDDVSLSLERGDIVGLVGESGSGKTTLCRALLGLDAVSAGRVTYDGRLLADELKRDRLAFRRRVQKLLQDAAASLSPRMTIGRLLDEPLVIHGLTSPDARQRLDEICDRLGLPADIRGKYPHQVSGGQARRVAMARALVLRPELIVADEPTAGLDVSVQGDLLNLLLDLHAELGLTYLIVSHNLNVVRRITRRTVVMYLGQIVEEAPTKLLFATPAHPYTAALLSTNPSIDPKRQRLRIVLKGEIPSAIAPPSGCRFHTRCPHVQPRCRTDQPDLRDTTDGRRVRCHFPLMPTGPLTPTGETADAATQP